MKKLVLFLALISSLVASEIVKELVIYTNGTILTMDENMSQVEAIVVKEDRIIDLGELSKLKKEYNGEIIDLEGNTLMPGLIEAHTHLVLHSAGIDFVELSPLYHNSKEEMVEALKGAKMNENGWVIGVGWEPEGFFLSIEEMDELFPEVPLLVYQRGHGVWANTKGFELRGINNDTISPQGSQIVKDEEGKLTGYVSGLSGVFLMGGGTYPKGNIENMIKSSEFYASKGFTTVTEKGLNNYEDLENLIIATGMKEFKTRLVATIIDDFPNYVGLLPQLKSFENDLLSFPMVKTWIDGAVQGGNIDTILQYKNIEFNNYVGPWGTQEKYNEIALNAIKAGMGFTFHANGDKSVDMGLRAAEYAIVEGEKLGLDTSDFRILPVHISLTQKESLEHMKKIGASPTFMAGHFYHNGTRILDTFFGEIAHEYAFLIGDAVEMGLNPSIHNDDPVTPTAPFTMLEAMVTRKTREGFELGPNQKISVEEALKAYTINAAYQLYLEDEVGSLEKGKKADFVIINMNPLEIEEENISDIIVIETIMDGKSRYKNDL